MRILLDFADFSDFMSLYSKLSLRLARTHSVAQVLGRFLIPLVHAGQALLLSFIDPGVSGLLRASGQQNNRTQNQRH
ncbi:hypothetical protein [Wenzhouxiangella limi]|uniref:Uncharacterized protein n=1 Tax=Wenzhouxiangella limi TaxID=2707351 RepID=A0A845V0B9_9GAMM|nr:hypothetical protein [Wenzhouxiangella limi]NDY95650.1 hypothetical protein [Wenzhouxiangella limi]